MFTFLAVVACCVTAYGIGRTVSNRRIARLEVTNAVLEQQLQAEFMLNEFLLARMPKPIPIFLPDMLVSYSEETEGETC